MADRWLVDKTTGKLLVDENGYPLAVNSEDIGGGSGYIEAELVPSNTDINTYRGENYWGKTFYAGGNNTVQNIPIAGTAFSLEVLRSGAYATVQRITMLAVGSNNQPTVYTRSVSDTTTTGGEGTWTAWTEVAEANGTYPNMTVGKAQESNNNLLFNGTLRTDIPDAPPSMDNDVQPVPCWYLQYETSYNISVSEGNFTIEAISNVSTTRTLQFTEVNHLMPNTQYMITFKVNVTSGVMFQVQILDFEDDGDETTDAYVYKSFTGTGAEQIVTASFTTANETAKRTVRIGLATYGAQFVAGTTCTLYWAKLEEGDVSTAPNGLVQNATEALYAKTAECLGKQVNINQSNTGWVKVAYVSRSSFSSDGNYSCIMLVNGIYNVQGQSDAAESGIIELDIRDTGSTIQYYGINALSGNINVNEWCATADSDGVTVYVSLPAMYQCYLITVISEAWQTGLNVDFVALFNEYYGSTAPSGAVYAVRRNIASQSEKDIETISASGTTFTFGFADDTSKNVTVATDELEEVELSDVMPSTNILSNTTFGRTGFDNSVTTFSNYAAKYSQINAVYMYSIGSDGSPIASGSNNISIQDSVRYGDIRLVYTNTTQGLKILRPISITQGIGLNANAFTILFIDYNDDSGSFVPYACLYSITTGKFSNLPAITGYNLSGIAVEGILPYVSST